jgi:hypothetical protein
MHLAPLPGLLLLIAAAATAGTQTAAPTEPRCGSLGPSIEKGAVSRIGALFERPQSVSQLLQNLKLAYEKDLFIQPAIYEDENLKKFFAGTEVTWGNPRPLTTRTITAKDLEITADARVFPKFTIRILRSCTPLSKYVSPNHYVTYSDAENAHLRLQVDASPGFTVAAAHIESLVKLNNLTFVVKSDPRPTPPGLDHLHDNDSIQSITATQLGR